MQAKTNTCLRWMTVLTVCLPLLCAAAQSQTANQSPLSPSIQIGRQILITPATPQRPGAVREDQPMTPFERVVAPQLKLSMEAARAANVKTGPQSVGQAVPLGTGGSNVNFPGFVGVPFATISDGDTALTFNSVSGDFNHDGRMDVATIKIDGTINVILNPGTFAKINTLLPITSNNNGNPGSLAIASVAVADMNGDGFPDLIGLDIGNNAVVIWLNKGNGAFGLPTSYPVVLTKGLPFSTGNGGFIVVADFNGDGAPDVAVVSVNPTLSVKYVGSTVISEVTLVNDGTGKLRGLPQVDSTFKDYYYTQYGNAAVTFSSATTPSGLVFLLNDQGTNPPYNGAGTSLIAMTSKGDGTFSPAIEPSTPLVLDSTINVDDSVVATNLTSTTSGGATTDIVFQTGDGALYVSPFTIGNPTKTRVIAGVNNQLFAFGKTFVPPVTTAPTPASLISGSFFNQQTLNVADMNGDGLQDVIMYTEAAITIFPNAGAGVFTSAPVQMIAATPGIHQPQPAAYDGSKYNSLLSVDSNLGQIGYFQNLGAAASTQAGQFASAAPLASGTNTSNNVYEFGEDIQVVATADIDGDGIPEIIAVDVSNSLANVVIGYRNGALAGNQTSNYTFKTAITSAGIRKVSFSLDFVEPVTIKNSLGTSLILVTHKAGPFLITAGKDGVFGAPKQLPMGAHPPYLPVDYADVGDVNDDGIQDIVFAYAGDPVGGGTTPSGFYTLLGKADGTFQTATFTPLGKFLYQVRLINFTGAPGRLDIVALDQSVGSVYGAIILPNKGDGSGTFDLARANSIFPGYIFSDVVAGDYNSDGKQDLTLLSQGKVDTNTNLLDLTTSGVILLPGNGDYTFGQPTVVAPGEYAQWGTYADFNGDGNPDLALTEMYQTFVEVNNNVVPTVQILPNLGGGVFGKSIPVFSSFTPFNIPRRYSSDYVFAGNFTNSGGPDLLVSSQYGAAMFVNRGVTTLALTASSTTPNQGAAETLTATIGQVVSAGVDETGQVTFSVNGITLGFATVSGGVASFTTTALPVGTDTVTATFAGDSDHNASAASLVVTVSALLPTFALTTNTPMLSLQQGATGSVLITLAGNSTFQGSVQLTCTGAPAESTCTASPATVTLAPGQSTGITVVIATTPPNNSYHAANELKMTPLRGVLGSISFAGLLMMAWPRRRRLPKLITLLALVAVSFGSATVFTGCSSGASNQFPGTAPGSYSIVVTGVSGNITQSQTIAFTVTAAK